MWAGHGERGGAAVRLSLQLEPPEMQLHHMPLGRCGRVGAEALLATLQFLLCRDVYFIKAPRRRREAVALGGEIVVFKHMAHVYFVFFLRYVNLRRAFQFGALLHVF